MPDVPPPPIPDGCLYGCAGLIGLAALLAVIGVFRALFNFAFG